LQLLKGNRRRVSSSGVIVIGAEKYIFLFQKIQPKLNFSSFSVAPSPKVSPRRNKMGNQTGNFCIITY
jgi:hypothetical protein